VFGCFIQLDALCVRAYERVREKCDGGMREGKLISPRGHKLMRMKHIILVRPHLRRSHFLEQPLMGGTERVVAQNATERERERGDRKGDVNYTPATH